MKMKKKKLHANLLNVNIATLKSGIEETDCAREYELQSILAAKHKVHSRIDET